MRRLIVKPNPAWHEQTSPARFHTHIKLENNSEPRLQLAGFSYFGELGGMRHIPDGDHVILYPEHEAADWKRVIVSGAPNRIRATYAQWLAMLAAHRVNLVRVWLFDFVEADSYPFFHRFGSDQYDLLRTSQRYLRRLIRFIDIARKHGIVVHISIASDQMMRREAWKSTPFDVNHGNPDVFPDDVDVAGTTENEAGGGFVSFLNLEANETRVTIMRTLIQALAAAVKPYWNVMFELMNEAGVRPLARRQPLARWHQLIATWLDAALNDGSGKRTHLISVSAVDSEMHSIIDTLFSPKPLVDIVSLHGNQWGGPDRGTTPPTDATILAATSAEVKALHDRHPGRPLAVICDTDAFPFAQNDPGRYGRLTMQGQKLNFAHRWSGSQLSHAKLLSLLGAIKTATPADMVIYTDTTPRPAPLPVVPATESELAGTWVEHLYTVRANDIAIQRRDVVYVINDKPAPGGWGVSRWYPQVGWADVAGGAGTRITVDPGGDAWTVNHDGVIRRMMMGGWVTVAGPQASDIAAGADGSVWIVGKAPLPGGHEIYRWTGTGWQSVDGVAVRIAVDPIGQPWIVNAAGAVSYRDGSTWVNIGGVTAVDISVGQDDTVWVANNNFTQISYWIGSAWRTIAAGAKAIAVDHDGMPWFVNAGTSVVTQREVKDVTG